MFNIDNKSAMLWRGKVFAIYRNGERTAQSRHTYLHTMAGGAAVAAAGGMDSKGCLPKREVE